MGGGVPPTVSVIFKEKEVNNKKIPVSVKSDDHNEAESHLCFSAAILLISVMVRAFYGSLTIFIYILNCGNRPLKSDACRLSRALHGRHKFSAIHRCRCQHRSSIGRRVAEQQRREASADARRHFLPRAISITLYSLAKRSLFSPPLYAGV